MPRLKLDQILRYETPEESFLSERESGFVEVQATKPRGKGKRSLEDMMSSQPTDEAQAIYAMGRIAGFEDGIAKVLQLCSPEARAIVLKRRASLAKYWTPEGEENDQARDSED